MTWGKSSWSPNSNWNSSSSKNNNNNNNNSNAAVASTDDNNTVTFPPITANDPRRLLCHPHFIQKICKYINVRGDFAKAALLSHVNQGFDETLYHYSTLHTTFWNKIFNGSDDENFEEAKEFLLLHFKRDLGETSSADYEQSEEDEEWESDYEEEEDLQEVDEIEEKNQSNNSSSEQEVGETDSEDDYDDEDDDDDDDYSDSDDYDDSDDDYDDDDDDEDSDESLGRGACRRCPNCLQRRFVSLTREFKNAKPTMSHGRKQALMYKLRQVIDDCPEKTSSSSLSSSLSERFPPPGARSLAIFAHLRAEIVLKRLISSNGFSTKHDFTSIRRQRLLIEGFLPYHEKLPKFFHSDATNGFSLPPLFYSASRNCSSIHKVINTLMITLMKDRAHESLGSWKYEGWCRRWRPASDYDDDENERKSRASLAAPPPTFVLFKLAEAFFEHHGESWKSENWNPIMEAIRADDVEAFEAFVTAAATVALRRQHRKKLQDEEKRRKQQERAKKNRDDDDDDDDTSDSSTRSSSNKFDRKNTAEYINEQHYLDLEEFKIDEMKCSIVNDLELENTNAAHLLRSDWRELHSSEAVRSNRHATPLTQLTALRVAIICGSLKIFNHLSSGPYKTATALETVRPNGMSPHWMALTCADASSNRAPVCETVVELVQQLGIAPEVAAGSSAAHRRSVNEVPDKLHFVGQGRMDNRKEILKIVLTELLNRCLVVVVKSKDKASVTSSDERLVASSIWNFAHNNLSSSPDSKKDAISSSVTVTHLLVRTLRICLFFASMASSDASMKLSVDAISESIVNFGGEDLLRKLLFEGALLPWLPDQEQQHNRNTNSSDFSRFDMSEGVAASSSTLISFLSTKLFHEDFSNSIFFCHLRKYLQDDPSFILANLDRHSSEVSPLWLLISAVESNIKNATSSSFQHFAVNTFEFLVNKTNANNVFAMKRYRAEWCTQVDRVSLCHRIVHLHYGFADRHSMKIGIFRSQGADASSANDRLHRWAIAACSLKLLRALLQYVSVEYGHDRLQQFLRQRTEFHQETALHWCVEAANDRAARMIVKEFGGDLLTDEIFHESLARNWSMSAYEKRFWKNMMLDSGSDEELLLEHSKTHHPVINDGWKRFYKF